MTIKTMANGCIKIAKKNIFIASKEVGLARDIWHSRKALNVYCRISTRY